MDKPLCPIGKSTIVREKTKKRQRPAAWVSRLLPELTARVVEHVLFRPPPRSVARWPSPLMDDVERLSVGLGAHRLPAWSWQPTVATDERPPTALLVHGWAGRGSQLARFVPALRARGFRVVTYDALGHGDAPRSRTSLPHMADAVAEVAAWVGGVQAVIAHSLGAAATTLAIDRGLEIERVVFLAGVDSLESLTHGYLRQKGFSTRVIDRVAERSAVWLGMRWSQARTSRLAVERSQPLLAFHDADDRSVPALHGHRIAQAWPGARLEVTRGLGHREILRNAGVIGRATDFVARSTDRATAQPAAGDAVAI